MEELMKRNQTLETRFGEKHEASELRSKHNILKCMSNIHKDETELSKHCTRTM